MCRRRAIIFIESVSIDFEIFVAVIQNSSD